MKLNVEVPISQEWLLEESSDLVYVCDMHNYNLLYMNEGARKIFQVEGESYLDRKCYEVLQNREEPCTFCTNHLLGKEEFYVWKFRNKTVGRTMLLRDRIIDWYGTPARIEFATDVSKIDEKNQLLEAQVKIDKTIISCLRILNSNPNMGEIIVSMLEALAEFYNADRVFILDYQENCNLLHVKYEWNRKGNKALRELIGETGIPADNELQNCFANRKNYCFESQGKLENNYNQYRQRLYRSGVYLQRGAPIYIESRPAGMIGVDNPKTFCEEMTVLETLSYFISEELERSKLSAALEFMSYHDALTGLWNRNHYVEYLSTLRKRQLKSLGIAVADINALKEINRYRGHTEGDEVVKRAARLLNESFPNAHIFRLSGDEFIVHCEDLEHAIFVEQVKQSRENASDLEAYGISVGYAWTDQEIDYSRLTMQATDIMMIQKREFYQYQNVEGQSARYKSSEQQELMEYIQQGYFQMFLQPKADCNEFKLNGAEALVRFYSEEQGFVAPQHFIPRLEREHLIQFVDIYIFEEVCKLLEKWKREGRRMITISLNFSRQTLLDPELLNHLIEMTDKYHVPKEYIEVEITESLGDYESLTIGEISQGIKKVGFQLALDDFGSHYTNMAMLANVPVDVLKLDQGMMRGVMSSISNQLVLKSIISLCKELGISSIAEGVETQEQLELLQALQCDSIQGYLFGKPMSVEQFEREYM